MRGLLSEAEVRPTELLASTRPARRSFYARPTVYVAKALLGAMLVHRTAQGVLGGRIVEVEAYLGQDDPAAHSSAGLTPRTRVIFGPPGHAYVYRIYGMHCCLNAVAEPEGLPGCVLIRALEPICGIEVMQARRPAARRLPDIANGPGKLTIAMAISMSLYGADLTRGQLTIRIPDTIQPVRIATTRRVGISKATELDLRFFIANNEFVSRR